MTTMVTVTDFAVKINQLNATSDGLLALIKPEPTGYPPIGFTSPSGMPEC